jgi:hypothetical protein
MLTILFEKGAWSDQTDISSCPKYKCIMYFSSGDTVACVFGRAMPASAAAINSAVIGRLLWETVCLCESWQASWLADVDA